MQESVGDNNQQKDRPMKMKSRKSGFTLVELMIVAIIVAILAAVAIPLMGTNKKRAMMTEAEAGLGMLRSSLRTLYAESGAYNKDRNGNPIVAGSITNIPGVSTNDIAGRWFDGSAYDLQVVASNSYTVRCQGDVSSTANKADVAGLSVTLNEGGTFTRTGY
jgi:prepilin-type N-terminal cleavage/methylation domain-containing protein